MKEFLLIFGASFLFIALIFGTVSFSNSRKRAFRLEACKAIENKHHRNTCLLYLNDLGFSNDNNIKICNKIKDSELRDKCLYKIKSK